MPEGDLGDATCMPVLDPAVARCHHRLLLQDMYGRIKQLAPDVLEQQFSPHTAEVAEEECIGEGRWSTVGLNTNLVQSASRMPGSVATTMRDSGQFEHVPPRCSGRGLQSERLPRASPSSPGRRHGWVEIVFALSLRMSSRAAAHSIASNGCAASSAFQGPRRARKIRSFGIKRIKLTKTPEGRLPG